MFKNAALAIGTLILAAATIFLLQYAGWMSYTFWAPKWEDSRRNKFEHSVAYTHSMQRDLEHMRLEYLKTDNEAHKDALKATILHRVAPFDIRELSPTMQSFISELKRSY